LDFSPCKCTLSSATVDTIEEYLSYIVDHFEIVSEIKCTLSPGTVDTAEECLFYMVDHFEIVCETHVAQ
jgi:hypothetical protein